MTTVRVLWTSSIGPHDLPITQGLAGSTNFPAYASKVAKAAMQTNAPLGCVQMKWCSNGAAKDEQICPTLGESTADFINRAAQWIKDQLTEFPATGDCVPPYP